MGERNDPAILASLGDAVLYASDVALLERPRAWLNDHCVLFWQQLLERERFAQLGARAIWLQPAAAFSLQFLEPEELLVDSPGNVFRALAAAQLVLVPLVAGADAEQGGGAHWTLLAAHRAEPDAMLIFDSANSGIGAEARASAATLKALMGGEMHRARLARAAHAPQQTNGFDCGVFLCSFAESLLAAFAADPAAFSLRSAALPVDAAAKRAEMLAAALALRPAAPSASATEAA